MPLDRFYFVPVRGDPTVRLEVLTSLLLMIHVSENVTLSHWVSGVQCLI